MLLFIGADWTSFVINLAVICCSRVHILQKVEVVNNFFATIVVCLRIKSKRGSTSAFKSKSDSTSVHCVQENVSGG